MSAPHVIVVGAGTAGCVIARRLAEGSGKRVVLVEAGPRYPTWALHAPLAGLRLRPSWSWADMSIPQPHLGGRRIEFPMGRVVGGTSSINAMVAAPGPPADYDAWATAGNAGWSWDDVRPGWERAVSLPDTARLSVQPPIHQAAFSEAFLEACETAGLERRPLLSDAEPGTCGMFPLFQTRGVRSSAARYLHDLGPGTRLSIRTHTPVRRVLMDGRRAVGVELGGRRPGGTLVATEGVVLAAGAVLSPVLLQRSGIGPAARLEAAGIPVRQDLAGVGLNLQDHAGLPLVFESTVRSPGRPGRWWSAAVDYALFRRGVMASNCCEAGCFLGPAGATPDVEVFTHFQTRRHPQAVEFAVVLMHPRSRGSVALDAADPWGSPWIDPRILERQEDRAAVRDGVERVRAIAAQPALRRFGLGREILPGNLDADSHVRSHACSYHHPVGTCRMGDDRLAVVDPRLRVHGTDNLWVADNSIVPTIPAGHTAATAVIIGERAADLLSADLGRRGDG
jgi:choline dehydrogenase